MKGLEQVWIWRVGLGRVSTLSVPHAFASQQWKKKKQFCSLVEDIRPCKDTATVRPCKWKLLYSIFLWYCLLFIVLYKVVLTSQSVDEILEWDHSNECYWAVPVLSCGTVYCAVQGGSNFWVCGWNPKMWPFNWNHFSSTMHLMCPENDWR